MDKSEDAADVPKPMFSSLKPGVFEPVPRDVLGPSRSLPTQQRIIRVPDRRPSSPPTQYHSTTTTTTTTTMHKPFFARMKNQFEKYVGLDPSEMDDWDSRRLNHCFQSYSINQKEALKECSIIPEAAPVAALSQSLPARIPKQLVEPQMLTSLEDGQQPRTSTDSDELPSNFKPESAFKIMKESLTNLVIKGSTRRKTPRTLPPPSRGSFDVHTIENYADTAKSTKLETVEEKSMDETQAEFECDPVMLTISSRTQPSIHQKGSPIHVQESVPLVKAPLASMDDDVSIASAHSLPSELDTEKSERRETVTSKDSRTAKIQQSRSYPAVAQSIERDDPSTSQGTLARDDAVLRGESEPLLETEFHSVRPRHCLAVGIRLPGGPFGPMSRLPHRRSRNLRYDEFDDPPTKTKDVTWDVESTTTDDRTEVPASAPDFEPVPLPTREEPIPVERTTVEAPTVAIVEETEIASPTEHELRTADLPEEASVPGTSVLEGAAPEAPAVVVTEVEDPAPTTATAPEEETLVEAENSHNKSSDEESEAMEGSSEHQGIFGRRDSFETFASEYSHMSRFPFKKHFAAIPVMARRPPSIDTDSEVVPMKVILPPKIIVEEPIELKDDVLDAIKTQKKPNVVAEVEGEDYVQQDSSDLLLGGNAAESNAWRATNQDIMDQMAQRVETHMNVHPRDARIRGIGFFGLMMGRTLSRQKVAQLAPELRRKIQQGEQKRPFFTWWVTIIQIIICVAAISLHSLGEKGIDRVQRKEEVKDVSLTPRHVSYFESSNFWIGPKMADLIRLGAKYSPCMRKEKLLWDGIEAERRKENNTGCCIFNDKTGCYQSGRESCPGRIATWYKWKKQRPLYRSKSDSELLKLGKGPAKSSLMLSLIDHSQRSAGAVCGQDPDFCIVPASVGAHTWKDDLTQWPICRETHPADIRNPHMTCELTGRPCCIQLQGLCRIATQEYCDFVQGHWHENATLCSQVNCFSDICGMLPFFGESPDQIYRLFLSIFLHAGLLHLAISVVFQLLVMRDLEKLLGWSRMAPLYIISGVGGNLASAIFVPYNPEVGPSGSQLGILGALLVDIIHHRHILYNPVYCFMSHITLVLILILIGLLPWVDNWAHLFGLLFGFLITLAIFPYIDFISPAEAKDLSKSKLLTLRRHKRMILIMSSSVALTIIFGLLAFVFFSGLEINCSWCQHFNCLNIMHIFNSTAADPNHFCDNHGLNLTQWLPI